MLSAVFGIFSLGSYAKTNSNKTPDYSIKKDSLISSPPVDTNKKTITFPNPFNVFMVGEGKNSKD